MSSSDRDANEASP